MSFTTIKTVKEILPFDILHDPKENNFYRILDKDDYRERLLVQSLDEHLSISSDRKIVIHKDSVINRWEKLQ